MRKVEEDLGGGEGERGRGGEGSHMIYRENAGGGISRRQQSIRGRTIEK